MAAEIVMPKFGFSMELGTLVEWKVKVGDPVKRNDPIAEIESEKLTNTANSTIDGVIADLKAFDDRSLRAQVTKSPKAMAELVREFFHCG